VHNERERERERETRDPAGIHVAVFVGSLPVVRGMGCGWSLGRQDLTGDRTGSGKMEMVKGGGWWD
jgi:hypothetical protein